MAVRPITIDIEDANHTFCKNSPHSRTTNTTITNIGKRINETGTPKIGLIITKGFFNFFNFTPFVGVAIKISGPLSSFGLEQR